MPGVAFGYFLYGENMKKRSWIILFFISFSLTCIFGLLTWKFFWRVPQEIVELQPKQVETKAEEVPGEQPTPMSTYEMIDLDMPVEIFLARGTSSSQISMVRRLLLKQWISSNQKDLLKLVVYGQGATSFNELKKLLEMAVEKEGGCNNACSVIQGAIKIIHENEDLMQHVDKSLQEGMSSDVHMLRGQMMNIDQGSKEYKTMKAQYRKALETWMDKKHGAFIDKVITKV